jgi:ABC-type polysaccharide/polyol phosphate export permease
VRALLDEIDPQGAAVQRFTVHSATLDDVFLALTGHAATTAEQSGGHPEKETVSVMDISGAAALSGHVVASLVRNAVSTTLVLGVGFLIGFGPHAGPLDWMAAAGIWLAFILAFSWLSAAIGLVAGSPEAASGFTFLLMFLPCPSSAFVPINTMPAVIRGFAHHQPATPVIDSVRGLLMGTPVGDSPWLARSHPDRTVFRGLP